MLFRSDVFEISKAASDQLPVKPEVLDFGKLLRQTLADMDGEIQKFAAIISMASKNLTKK